MLLKLDKPTLALVKEIGVCGVALIMIVLHLLGFLPSSSENVVPVARASGPRVEVQCFDNGECRRMEPTP